MTTQGYALTYINSFDPNNFGREALFPPFLGQEAEAQISGTMCSWPTHGKAGIQMVLWPVQV